MPNIAFFMETTKKIKDRKVKRYKRGEKKQCKTRGVLQNITFFKFNIKYKNPKIQ